MPCHLCRLAPFQDRGAGEFGAVIGNDGLRPAAPGRDPVEFTRNAGAGDRGIRYERQALSAAVIGHGKNAKAPPVKEGIAQKIEAPPLVDYAWNRQWRSRAQSPLAPAAAADLKPLLPVKTPELLMIDGEPFPPHQPVQAAIAKPPPLARKLTKALADGIVRRTHA